MARRLHFLASVCHQKVNKMNTRGYFGIGIWHPKKEINQGTLWRSAFAFGASFIFTVGARFTKQNSDTPSAWHHIPMLTYDTLDELMAHLPFACPLVGVELNKLACPLDRFVHPERACYLLGAEDQGLSPEVMKKCHILVQVPGLASCLNVSTTGSLVLYDRQIQKVGTKCLRRSITI